MTHIYSLKTILKENSFGLVISIVIGVFAGLLLDRNGELLVALPSVLLIIPSFNGMMGNLSSVLSSRLSSALHMGMLNTRLRRTNTLDTDIASIISTSIISLVVIGLLAGSLSAFLGYASVNIFAFSFVVLLAGIVTILVLSSLSILMSFISFSRGMDPDNWVVSVLTSLGDFIGIFTLVFMISLVA